MELLNFQVKYFILKSSLQVVLQDSSYKLRVKERLLLTGDFLIIKSLFEATTIYTASV